MNHMPPQPLCCLCSQQTEPESLVEKLDVSMQWLSSNFYSACSCGVGDIADYCLHVLHCLVCMLRSMACVYVW